MNNDYLMPAEQRGGIAEVQQQPIGGAAGQFQLFPALAVQPSNGDAAGDRRRYFPRRHQEFNIGAQGLQGQGHFGRESLYARKFLGQKTSVDV
jgi:hypothetical protein